MTNSIQLRCQLKQNHDDFKEFILYPTDRIHSPVGSLITMSLTKNGCEFTDEMGEHINFFAATSNLHTNQIDYKNFIYSLGCSLNEVFKAVNLDKFDILVESKNSNYLIKII